MFLRHVFICLMTLVIFNSYSFDSRADLAHQEESDSPANAHAPIGVMGEHIHKSGEWMVSFRTMVMDMPEHYAGSKKQTINQVHNDYVLAPVKMSMKMQMLGIMHAPTDEVTLMLMIPKVTKNMEHRRRTDNRQFSVRTQGIGDVKLSGILKALENEHHQGLVNLGMSFPTGSIDETSTTLLGEGQNVPYPMQLGSGTYDFLPGLTYNGHSGKWSWGSQFRSTIRLGKNHRKYSLGDEFGLSNWIVYQWERWISTSVRIDGKKWGNINGRDQRLNVLMIPTADPEKRGGERLDLLFGVNLIGQKGKSRDHRLALEFGFPVYQHLDGPQLGAGLQGTIGWQKAW